MLPPPLLSVIVPFHNPGALFVTFMASLLGQTFKDLEIILIDDGSTDGSAERAEAYASQALNIRVIHQLNGGVSRARNAGLQYARGQYVAFPDADDVLDPELYSTLMCIALADNLDAVQCNAHRVSSAEDTGQILIPLTRLRSTGILKGSAWLNKALKTRRYLHVVWLGVYRLSLIRQIGLQFVPGLHHQDIPWSTEFMLNARRVRYIEQSLYRYLVHPDSISNRRRTGRANRVYQRHYLKICRMLEQINQRYRNKVKPGRALYSQVTREALNVCHAIRREPNEATKRAMIADIWRTGTHYRMLRNTRGIRQWYQLVLWLSRLLLWRRNAGKI